MRVLVGIENYKSFRVPDEVKDDVKRALLEFTKKSFKEVDKGVIRISKSKRAYVYEGVDTSVFLIYLRSSIEKEQIQILDIQWESRSLGGYKDLEQSSIPEKIREVLKLKEDGILTEEEYLDKKKELLERI